MREGSACVGVWVGRVPVAHRNGIGFSPLPCGPALPCVYARQRPLPSAKFFAVRLCTVKVLCRAPTHGKDGHLIIFIFFYAVCFVYFFHFLLFFPFNCICFNSYIYYLN